ncbi:MAG: GNAT family N-acetyltransferase [Planctomycetes bacterium]|nr:GNAT family N-acetyltransferase [Planctomycetota bacterium]
MEPPPADPDAPAPAALGGVAAAENRATPVIRVRPLTRADDPARDAVVRSAPAGSFFHLAGWERAVERVFGHEPRTLGAFRGDQLVGVLPLMSCRTPRFSRNLVSMPYGVYGGPASTTAGADAALVEAAVRLAEEQDVGRLELRCVEDPGTPGFTGTDLYAAFVAELPRDPEELWTRMPKRARAEVRKTIERNRLSISEGPWYADDLYELFHQSKKKLGSPALPRAWYRALLEELSPHVLVHVARASSEPLAATMSFVHGRKFDFYYIGVTDEANREFNVTNFLVVRLQELCVRRGIELFDLGRSRVGSGPYQFKKNQGFEPRPLAYRTKLVRARAVSNFNPSNPRTERLRNAWARLPDGLTRALSGPLMRYLP